MSNKKRRGNGRIAQLTKYQRLSHFQSWDFGNSENGYIIDT